MVNVQNARPDVRDIVSLLCSLTSRRPAEQQFSGTVPCTDIRIHPGLELGEVTTADIHSRDRAAGVTSQGTNDQLIVKNTFLEIVCSSSGSRRSR